MDDADAVRLPGVRSPSTEAVEEAGVCGLDTPLLDAAGVVGLARAMAPEAETTAAGVASVLLPRASDDAEDAVRAMDGVGPSSGVGGRGRS
jgi:hypothetical protein